MGGRIFYPYEIEWIEGGILQGVVRITEGLPLYAAPSMDYVPSLYAPFYFYLSAFSSLILGVGLPALRAVSVVAALLTAVMVGSSVWQLTRSRLAAMLALLSWGAMYRFSGNWYDLARVDSLWASCLTAAVTSLIFFSVQRKKYFLGLAVFSLLLAIFTKQATLILIPFFLVAVWCWADFVSACRFGILILLLTAIVAGILQWQSSGYFYFYTMKMASSHHFNHGIPMNFLHGDLLLGIPIYLALSLGFIAWKFSIKRDAVAWLALLSGFLLMSLLSRWYAGGFLNVLMPLHQLILIMAISGFSTLLFKANMLFSNVARYSVMITLTILLTLNVLIGWFNPTGKIPTSADRSCGDKIIKQLSSVDGRVCVSRHGYLAYLAGKSFCAHEAFSVDVLNGSNAEIATKLMADTHDRLIDGYYQVLLLDTQAQFTGYGISFDQLFYTATDIDCPKDAFYPLVAGQRPLHWLQYNGQKMNDLRVIR